MSVLANYYFNFYAIPVGVAAISVLIMGIIVFLQNTRSVINLFFALTCLSVFLWLSGFSMIYLSKESPVALSWFRYYSLIGIVTIAPNIYFFVRALAKSLKNQKRLVISVYSLALISYLSGFNSHFATGAMYFWGWYPLFGPFSYPFLTFFLVLMFVSFRELWLSQGKMATKIENKRIKIVFIGVLVGYTAALDFLPALQIGLYPFGYFYIFVWISFMGYAVFRYKLMKLTPAIVAEQVISIIPNFLILVDREGKIIRANRAIEEALGYDKEELIKKPVEAIIPQKDTVKLLFSDLEKKETIANLETTYQSKGGKAISVIFSGAAIHNDAGDIVGFVVTALDNTGRKKAEEERERLIKELKEHQELLEEQKQGAEDSGRAVKNVAEDLMESKKILEYQKKSLEGVNKELDDFTYIVSHDLKEPLRSIDAYSKFIADDYKDKLGEEGRHYLERVRANTERMKRLIEDLLEISRLKKRGSTIVEVATEDIIGEVEMRLEYAIKQKAVEIIIKDKLPRMFCDRVRLTEAFLNLVSNAIKFNDKQKPVIEIGCSEKGDFYEFYVRDNGIGIQEEYFDKIFEIFQRLGKREDAEGTGAGLTIVKKIIQLHRGKIWLESKIGEGSTFYFNIPKEKSVILGNKLIGEILVEKKLVTEDEIKKALDEQERTGRIDKGGQDGGRT
ncbi:MAG: ATP-binding protein [Candidatus Omnitrophica bacterium]|nr:ATP-binding protein [Candidatus Omnitrophota bacterium]